MRACKVIFKEPTMMDEKGENNILLTDKDNIIYIKELFLIFFMG